VATCYQCGRQVTSPKYGVLGQPMCARCETTQTGLIVGGAAGGAGGAAAGPRLLTWIRRSLGRGRIIEQPGLAEPRVER
jgi:hypothetical protein